MEIRYFDNAATTKVKEEVLKEMFPYFSVDMEIHHQCIQ